MQQEDDEHRHHVDVGHQVQRRVALAADMT
jgi:hypothetical protein